MACLPVGVIITPVKRISFSSAEPTAAMGPGAYSFCSEMASGVKMCRSNIGTGSANTGPAAIQIISPVKNEFLIYPPFEYDALQLGYSTVILTKVKLFYGRRLSPELPGSGLFTGSFDVTGLLRMIPLILSKISFESGFS